MKNILPLRLKLWIRLIVESPPDLEEASPTCIYILTSLTLRFLTLTLVGNLIFVVLDAFAPHKNGSHIGTLGIDMSSTQTLKTFNVISASV